MADNHISAASRESFVTLTVATTMDEARSTQSHSVHAGGESAFHFVGTVVQKAAEIDVRACARQCSVHSNIAFFFLVPVFNKDISWNMVPVEGKHRRTSSIDTEGQSTLSVDRNLLNRSHTNGAWD